MVSRLLSHKFNTYDRELPNDNFLGKISLSGCQVLCFTQIQIMNKLYPVLDLYLGANKNAESKTDQIELLSGVVKK